VRRAIALVALAVLAGCGSDSDPVASTPTSTATATATATPTATASAAATPAEGECDEVEYTPQKDAGGSVHPNANFFEPGAEGLPSKADLDHLLLVDNAVVIYYAADTPRKDIDRFSTWWAQDVKQRTPVVIPDDAPDALPVRARIATVELRCNGLDWNRLTKFANRTDIAPSVGDHG
jgi:hypothetical protein